MPELSEVIVISNCIYERIFNKYLVGLVLHSGSRYCKDGNLTLSDEEIVGEPIVEGNEYYYNIRGKVLDVFTEGKKIFIELKLEGGGIIFIMTFLALFGTLRFDKSNDAKHTLIFSEKEDGDDTFELHYHDKRNWGLFSIVNDYRTLLSDTGPSFLSKTATLDYFASFFKNIHPVTGKKVWRTMNKNIGWFLLEQKYVSGVGVYIKSEALYALRIHPDELLTSFTEDEIESLYNIITDIVKESVSKGGYSIKDYVNPYGIKGTYKPKIVDQKFDPLGNPVEKITHADRNLYYVPNLQKIKHP